MSNLPLGTRVRVIRNAQFAADRSQRHVGEEGVTLDTDAAPDVLLDSGSRITCDLRELEELEEVPPAPVDPVTEKKAAVEQAMAEYWEASRVVDAAYAKVQALLKP